LKAYDGYLFDLDGTLIDTAPDINAALNHALTQQGAVPVDEALTRHWVGHGARALIGEAIKSQQLAEALAEPLFESFFEYYSAHLTVLSTPYPEVVETLRTLRDRGARLAVVTNKLALFTEPLLAELGLADDFDAIVSGDTAANPKPAADPALFACDALSVAPATALFVGDSAADVGCARAAGCPVVVVRDGYNHGIPADELGADAVIESFSDLV
jgi:phosphoglycolate phosphatase